MRSRTALSFRSFLAWAVRTSRLKRLADVWGAVAVVLLVSIGGTAAQPKSGETAAQPKKLLFLHSFGPNFQSWATWSREIRNELNKQSHWPLDIQEQSLVTARGGDNSSEAKFAEYLGVVCTENLIRVDAVMESPKLAE